MSTAIYIYLDSVAIMGLLWFLRWVMMEMRKPVGANLITGLLFTVAVGEMGFVTAYASRHGVKFALIAKYVGPLFIASLLSALYCIKVLARMVREFNANNPQVRR